MSLGEHLLAALGHHDAAEGGARGRPRGRRQVGAAQGALVHQKPGGLHDVEIEGARADDSGGADRNGPGPGSPSGPRGRAPGAAGRASGDRRNAR